jgi:hypothetical protein
MEDWAVAGFDSSRGKDLSYLNNDHTSHEKDPVT